MELSALSTARVRAWHADLINAGHTGRTTVAKCYRLLRTILGTAVEDELILKNPCGLKGAGVERPPERPIATIEQVYALADVIEPRYRALVAPGHLHRVATGRTPGPPSRAALIYQHATKDRDAVIAAALSDLIESATARPSAPIEPIRPVDTQATRSAAVQDENAAQS